MNKLNFFRVRKIFLTIFLIIYFAAVIFFIFRYSYQPQTNYLLAFFFVTNFPTSLALLLHRNSTELKAKLIRKDLELSLSKKRFSGVIDLLPQMVYEYKNEDSGKVVFINNFGLKLLGYSEHEAKQLNYLDIFDASEREKIIKEKERIIKSRQTTVSEYLCTRKDGSRFPAALYSAPISNERNEIVGIRSILIDLTEVQHFKETVEQLTNLDKTKDDFLNIAAHELKTPLTSILVMSEILLQNPAFKKNPETKEQLDVIFNEANRLKKIVDQILTITRFENKRPMAKDEPFDLIAAINNFLPTLQALAVTKKSNFTKEIKLPKAMVKANADKILEVIYNLVDNAMKYGGDNNDVEMVVFKEGNRVRVEIKDHGDGISQDKAISLFNKFSQMETTMTRSQEGIGLGLYICRLIIEAYGGQIGVDSRVHQGSTFYFTLPLFK